MHSFFLGMNSDAKNTFFYLLFCFKDKNVEIKLMRCEVKYWVLHNNKKFDVRIKTC